MIGAIAGDIIGSVHEGRGTKTKTFPLFTASSRFTDDSVLTLAVAEKHLLDGNYVNLFHDYYQDYPLAGYGGSFMKWAERRDREPYNSWGNGSAMRVSPVGFIGQSWEEVLQLAKESAEVTHNHPEGIKGAQAVAAAIYLARNGSNKTELKKKIESTFGYDLSGSLDEIRKWYEFDVSCKGSVPQSIIAFLESSDYEDAIRNAISLGGDADTMACIAGGIAEAFYGEVPEPIRARALTELDDRMLGIVNEFYERFVDRFRPN